MRRQFFGVHFGAAAGLPRVAARAFELFHGFAQADFLRQRGGLAPGQRVLPGDQFRLPQVHFMMGRREGAFFGFAIAQAGFSGGDFLLQGIAPRFNRADFRQPRLGRGEFRRGHRFARRQRFDFRAGGGKLALPALLFATEFLHFVMRFFKIGGFGPRRCWRFWHLKIVLQFLDAGAFGGQRLAFLGSTFFVDGQRLLTL